MYYVCISMCKICDRQLNSVMWIQSSIKYKVEYGSSKLYGNSHHCLSTCLKLALLDISGFMNEQLAGVKQLQLYQS